MNANPGAPIDRDAGPTSRVRVVRLAEVDSTNRAAERLVSDEPASEAPLAVVAERQSAGEGRRPGASWASPAGGLWLTLAWPLAPRDDAVLSGLGLRLGLACLRAVGSTSAPLVPALKWPNDVLLEGRKVCGCMARVITPGGASGRRWILAAAGVNANNEIPPELSAVATGLREATGREIDLRALEARLLAELSWALTARTLDTEMVREATDALAGVGRTIRLRDRGAIVEGELLGLGASGAPRIRTPRGEIEAGPGAETAHDA